MKKLPSVFNRLFLFSFVLLAVSACRRSGSGLVVRETISLSNFDRIEVDGPFNVFVEPNDTPRVVIEADDNLQKLFKVEQNGSTVSIELRRQYRNPSQQNVYIYTPSLTYWRQLGEGESRTLSALQGDRLEFIKEGQGNAKISTETRQLSIRANNRGNLFWDGETQKANISYEGSGQFEGFALGCDTLDLDFKGSDIFEITVFNEMSVRNTGSGTVVYDGSPVIRFLSNIGTGVVRPR